MNYFTNCNTLNELRTEYRRLLKLHHPDNGGSEDLCKILNKEYDNMFNNLKNTTSQNTDNETNTWDIQLDKEIRDMIKKVVIYNDIEIEIIGSWIWIDGSTYPIKDILTSYKFKWSKSRKKWHWTPSESFYIKSKKKLTFDDIRNKYGSIDIINEPLKKIV